MRIFLTGATGFIGSAIIPELLQAGHQVLGLTRSDAGEQSLLAAGAEAHRGSLEDPESLRRGAAEADGVIHCAFDHDFSDLAKFAALCQKDKRAIEAMGDALAGSDRPLVITSGTGVGNSVPGQLATENDLDRNHPIPRIATEIAAASVAERGVNVSVVRLPQVHDTFKQGLVSFLIQMAREKGVSPYVGEGLSRWPAAHVLDVAQLYRLALEKNEPGSRYHAVAEEGVPMREIAETIGKGLKVPVKSISVEAAPAHFGWLAAFTNFDAPASSAQTRQQLGWNPSGPGLIADLQQMRYF
jgi:nucleoside-diphosphate-sugar epimerase